MEFDEEDYDPEELEDTEVNVEDYIFSLNVTDKLRKIFILIMLVGNFISINIAIVFICLAWYIRSSVEKHITFLQDYYNPQAVPAMVGLSGFVMIVVSIFGVKVGMGERMAEDETEVNTGVDWMFIYTVGALVTFGAVLITAFTCFIDIVVLNAMLEDGLKSGMRKYKEEPEFKSEIDSLQLNYKCCGVESFKDWYNISWVALKYLDLKIIPRTKKKEYFGKDVPFSCCTWDVMRPCVDTRIEDGSYNPNYQFPSDLTIHKTGCKEAVSTFLGHSLLKGVGLFALFCTLLWISLAVTARYLSTSMLNSSLGEPPIGWLIPCVRPKKRRNTVKFELEEVETEA